MSLSKIDEICRPPVTFGGDQQRTGGVEIAMTFDKALLDVGKVILKSDGYSVVKSKHRRFCSLTTNHCSAGCDGLRVHVRHFQDVSIGNAKVLEIVGK